MRLRKLKRTTKQYITVALICITVIGSAAIITSIIMIGQIRQEYECMIKEARQEMNENKKTVFITLSDIRAGDILTEDKVEQKTVYSTQPVESYISGNELGKTAVIDIPKGTHVVKTMLARNSVSSVLREVEYDVIHISPNIMVNDYVDVRIIYPNGENFIVLTKKSLKGLQPDTPVCYMWVDEEEILRMSAAIVDAGSYEGSRLYLTKYIEPNIQDESLVTYVPNISVLSLIENDPNIVERCSQLLNKEVRKAMENRLAKSSNMDVNSISWEIDDTNIPVIPSIQSKRSGDDCGNININQANAIESEIEKDGNDKNDENDEDKGLDTGKNNNEDKDNKTDKNNIESEVIFPELGTTDTNYNNDYIFATEG
ncbi:MAG TPA: hypothetical protein GX002_07985 [Clostridiales bacterium]|nr:hypothetical protein [Clostridiales bacterium]